MESLAFVKLPMAGSYSSDVVVMLKLMFEFKGGGRKITLWQLSHSTIT